LGGLKQDQDLINRGLELADWLVARQQNDGSWEESPGGWKGTTVFQLLALAAAIDMGGPQLSGQRRGSYLSAAIKASEWVLKNITFRRVTTNYVASAAAALAIVNRVLPERRWLKGAKRLAGMAISRINRDGLIEGEGQGRRILKKIYIRPMGIDIGYGLEMSLASLSLYAAVTGDQTVGRVVEKALTAHIFFIYPDGSLDNSIGSRGYKWTIYGSKTAHGSQMALAFMASRDGVAATAQRLCTRLLDRFIVGGLLSNGPNHQEVGGSLCIYPTVVRAVNLAFALAYFPPPTEVGEEPIPAQKDQWVKRWPTLNSLHVRRAPWMATVSGYDEATLFKTNDKEDWFRVPSGGSLTYLYHDDWGPVQAATQLKYGNWEPMHLPPNPGGLMSLTPRIEVTGGAGQTSNAQSGRVRLMAMDAPGRVEVVAAGSFAEKGRMGSGLGSYEVTYLFERDRLRKRYKIHLSESPLRLAIIEPMLLKPGERWEHGLGTVAIGGNGGWIRVELDDKDRSAWALKPSDSSVICPMPALIAYPVVFYAKASESRTYEIELVFEVQAGLGSCPLNSSNFKKG
jgi:hypothetical protein